LAAKGLIYNGRAMRPTKTVDEIKIQRGLLTAFLLVVCVFSAWFGFSRGIPAAGLLIPAVAVTCWFYGNPGRLLLAALFFESASIVIPGIPSILGVKSLFYVLTIGWAVLHGAFRERGTPSLAWARQDFWLFLFAGNLLFLMVMRGSGFALLGSRTFGGTQYLFLFIAIGFYFSAIRMRIENRLVKKLLWVLFIAAIIPAVTEVLVTLSGGFFWLSAIVDTRAEQLMIEGMDEAGVQRWGAVGSMGSTLIILAFVLCKKTVLRYGLFLAALVLVALSGFRGRIFAAGVIVFCLSLYDAKSPSKVLLFWVLAGVAGLAFLMVAAPFLPRAIQRAVSFIEFIPVDHEIAKGASGSRDWRFDLWRDYCIPNVPRYLLIGRGIAHDISGFAWLQAHWYEGSEFFYYMGNYHSGPFSLLLDHGLIGTVAFTLFFSLITRDAWRTLKRARTAPQDPLIFRYYAYLTILMTYRFFSYYLIFGDVRESLPKMLLTAIQLRVLKKNLIAADVQVVEAVKPKGAFDLHTSLTSGNRRPNQRPDHSPSILSSPKPLTLPAP